MIWLRSKFGRVGEVMAESLDRTIPTVLSQLLPTPPVLTSQAAGWRNLFLADYLHPGWEIPEYAIDLPVMEIIAPNHSPHLIRRVEGVYQSYRLDQGEIVFYPARCSHWSRWEDPVAFTVFIFEPEFFQKLIDETFDRARLELIPKSQQVDPIMHSLGDALKAELAAGCPSGRLYGETFATALALHCIKHFATEPITLPEYKNKLTPNQIKHLLAHIDDHLTEHIGLEQLATMIGISVFHFCRLFKQSLGMAPHQYVILQRIERAKQLLQRGEMNLSEVAATCGFSHQSHLNRHFKRVVGITPKHFRDHSKNVLI